MLNSELKRKNGRLNGTWAGGPDDADEFSPGHGQGNVLEANRAVFAPAEVALCQHNRRSRVTKRFPDEFLTISGFHVGLRLAGCQGGGQPGFGDERLDDTADGRRQHVHRVLENVEHGERAEGLDAVQDVGRVTEHVRGEGGQGHDKGRYDGEERGEGGEVGDDPQWFQLEKVTPQPPSGKTSHHTAASIINLSHWMEKMESLMINEEISNG